MGVRSETFADERRAQLDKAILDVMEGRASHDSVRAAEDARPKMGSG